MFRIRPPFRPSLSLLFVAMMLLEVSTMNVVSQGSGLVIPAQRTNHGQIPQVGSQPDFQMQIPPNQFLLKTSTWANLSIYFTPINNFSGTVSLSGSISPSGSSTPTIRLPATAKVNWTISGIPHYFMIVNTTTATPQGLYTITVTGVSGSVSHSVNATVGVTSMFIPNNGAEMLYSANFTGPAFAGNSTVMNNTFEDLGYVSIGIWNLTVKTSFGTYNETGANYCLGKCPITSLNPYEEKMTPLVIRIPANTGPGNYSFTVTISWVLQPGSISVTPAPDLVAHGSIIVYSNAPGPLGRLNLNGLMSLLLSLVGGVAASAAIMFALLTVIERRRKDPFRGLSRSSGSVQPGSAATKSCAYCGQTVPAGEFCAECGSRLF
jgi:hypothetical protein